MLRHDKREWFKGCTLWYRLDRERNYTTQVLMSWEEREDSVEFRSVWFWNTYEGSKKVRTGQEIEAKIVYWNLKFQRSLLFYCKDHVMAVGV